MTTPRDGFFLGSLTAGRAGARDEQSPAKIAAVSGQALAATLPLPAIGAPFADVQQIKDRITEQVARQRSRGRHAAPRPTGLAGLYLSLRKSRFLIFSAIGGFVFVLGIAVQVWLTGTLHIRPEVSYLAQAVVSVEVSFALNRWLTWRDRDTRLLRAFAFFNLQKILTIAINSALYVGLLRLGMNYLLDNIVLTAAFTVINYVAGDKLVFVPVRKWRDSVASPVGLATDVSTSIPAAAAVRPQAARSVSVVIPVRDNERTIGATIRSLLAQDYPHLVEIVLVGSPGDRTWEGLSDITDRRLVTVEQDTPPGVRDANFKRDAGIRSTSGELVALVDSDIVLPSDWMSTAVAELEISGATCVTGGMKSAHNTFWGRYTDSTRLGAKTPRIARSYAVTKDDFGAGSKKPPITANTLFTREMYLDCPINPTWSHGSYEDYEWFWRVVSSGYSVTVCRDLFGWHEHRRGIRPLVREYLRSSRGCAYFIWAHSDCPLARRRLVQAIVLPIAGIVATIAAAGAVARGEGEQLAALIAAGMAVLAIDQFARSRRLESLAYPATGFVLGLVFTAGLLTNLIKSSPVSAGEPAQDYAALPAARDGVILTSRPDGISLTALLDQQPYSYAPPASAVASREAGALLDLPAPGEAPSPAREHEVASSDAGSGESPAPRQRHLPRPLIAVCALQAVLSLTLVWSNTAFTDEANYLWIGRLVLANWLHGKSWPAAYGQRILPGSPIIYPPLGDLASSVGGLAAARILSLVFMLATTVLLYLTTTRLIGKKTAIFAVTLWAITEPVLRLAFATPEALSVFLVALSAWLIVQAGYRYRHGEFVAAAALVLALANATAYSSLIIDPVVFAFAFLAWRPSRPEARAAYATAWLSGAWAFFFGLLLTRSRNWIGFWAYWSGRYLVNHQSISFGLTQVWTFAGLILIAAVVGIVVVIGDVDKERKALLVLLGSAGFAVPAVQVAGRATNLPDGHLAYGIWFAAIAAGYACEALIRRLAGVKRSYAIPLVALALCYPLVSNWQSAWEQYHSWPDAHSFIGSLRSDINRSHGLIFAASQDHVAEYYTSQGLEWKRWNTDGLSLAPFRPSTISNYLQELRSKNYGLIALFYSTSFRSTPLPGRLLTNSKVAGISQVLLSHATLSPNQSGLATLTRALQQDRSYRLVSVGSYDSANSYGLYAIWRKVPAK